jgi:hypothetical protein
MNIEYKIDEIQGKKYMELSLLILYPKNVSFTSLKALKKLVYMKK